MDKLVKICILSVSVALLIGAVAYAYSVLEDKETRNEKIALQYEACLESCAVKYPKTFEALEKREGGEKAFVPVGGSALKDPGDILKNYRLCETECQEEYGVREKKNLNKDQTKSKR